MGLRRGCVLAPTMFNLFIRDLSFPLDSSPKVQLGQMLINHLLYADDLALFEHSDATLQQLLDKLSIFADENKLTINLTKSKGMRFGAGIRRHVAPLNINGAVLEIVTSYKYLGYMFSSNGNWNLQDSAQALKCHQVVFSINKALAKFGCVHDLSTHYRLLFSKFSQLWNTGQNYAALSLCRSVIGHCRDMLKLYFLLGRQPHPQWHNMRRDFYHLMPIRKSSAILFQTQQLVS